MSKFESQKFKVEFKEKVKARTRAGQSRKLREEKNRSLENAAGISLHQCPSPHPF